MILLKCKSDHTPCPPAGSQHSGTLSHVEQKPSSLQIAQKPYMVGHLPPHLSDLISHCSPHLSFPCHIGFFLKHEEHSCLRVFALTVLPAWNILPPGTCVTGFVTSFRLVHRVTSTVMPSLKPFGNVTFSLTAHLLLLCFIFLLTTFTNIICYVFCLFYCLCPLLESKLHERRYLCLFELLLDSQSLERCLTHSRCSNKYLLI